MTKISALLMCGLVLNGCAAGDASIDGLDDFAIPTSDRGDAVGSSWSARMSDQEIQIRRDAAVAVSFRVHAGGALLTIGAQQVSFVDDESGKLTASIEHHEKLEALDSGCDEVFCEELAGEAGSTRADGPPVAIAIEWFLSWKDGRSRARASVGTGSRRVAELEAEVAAQREALEKAAEQARAALEARANSRRADCPSRTTSQQAFIRARRAKSASQCVIEIKKSDCEFAMPETIRNQSYSQQGGSTFCDNGNPLPVRTWSTGKD